ncbi:MAG TPA: hypothetical protein VKH64_09395 [Candidatus Binatia bacterium]|nr:hypothetical protein [Candidatus Binatia bacterium]
MQIPFRRIVALLRFIFFLLGAFFLMNLFHAASAAPTNACLLSSTVSERSCQASAQSDYFIALATCYNLADPGARKACQQQAVADQKDALQTCDDQNDARDQVCKQLGGAPYDPVIDPKKFSGTITNPFLMFTVGTLFVYESNFGQHNEVFVTNKTRNILGADCREVHDTVKVNGKLTEDTLDWYCQDQDGNVLYFGENSQELEDGLVVSLEGSWTGGIDGAKPGIAMKANPKVGDVYRQEFLPGVAEDIAEVLSVTETITLAGFGTMTNCVKTKETTPLEPDALENKIYCPGVGLVRDIDLQTGEILDLVSKTP